MEKDRAILKRIAASVRAFHADDTGPTTTEYVIIVSLVAIALIAVVTTFGERLASMFSTATDQLESNVEGQSY
jgi:Flp pilus assembly pilin Flp